MAGLNRWIGALLIAAGACGGLLANTSCGPQEGSMRHIGQIWALDGEEALATAFAGEEQHLGLVERERVRWEIDIGRARVMRRPWPVVAGGVASVVVRERSDARATSLRVLGIDRASGGVLWDTGIEGMLDVQDGFGTSAADDALAVHHVETDQGSFLVAVDARAGLLWSRLLESRDQLRRLSLHPRALVVEGFDRVMVLARGDGRTLREWEVDGEGCLVGSELTVFPRDQRVVRHDLDDGSEIVSKLRPAGGLPAGCARRGDRLIVRLTHEAPARRRIASLAPNGDTSWIWDAGTRAVRTKAQALIDFAPVVAAPLAGRVPRYLPVALADDTTASSASGMAVRLALLDLDTGTITRTSEAATTAGELRVMRQGTRFLVTWGRDDALLLDGESGRLEAVFAATPNARVDVLGLSPDGAWWQQDTELAAQSAHKLGAAAVARAASWRALLGKDW